MHPPGTPLTLHRESTALTGMLAVYGDRRLQEAKKHMALWPSGSVTAWSREPGPGNFFLRRPRTSVVRICRFRVCGFIRNVIGERLRSRDRRTTTFMVKQAEATVAVEIADYHFRFLDPKGRTESEARSTCSPLASCLAVTTAIAARNPGRGAQRGNSRGGRSRTPRW